MRAYQRQKEPRKGMAVHPLVYWIWSEMNKQRASQEDVATRSGVASSTMRKWRVGVRSPRIMELEAVINALGYQLAVRKKKDD
jgi:transcriptional regulator with XRE-family HTH domain